MNKLVCKFLAILVISSILTACTGIPTLSDAPQPTNKPALTEAPQPTNALLPSLHQRLASVTGEDMRTYLQTMVVNETHNIFYRHSDQLKQNQTYIESTLNNLGYEVTQHSFVSSGTTYQNVIATHLGTRHPDQRVLVIAHFDIATYASGADDNISGVAVMLELAKRLQPYPFEYTIQFVATNQEENSLAGSQALANFAKENGWKIKGVIVLDQVGYAGETLKQSAPPGLKETAPQVGNFIAAIGNETSKELAEQFIVGIQQQQIPLPYESTIVPGNGEQIPMSRHSDHAPFWDAGYPAILVTDTGELRNPNTHYSTDRIDSLNLEFLANVCRAVGELVNTLALSVD